MMLTAKTSAAGAAFGARQSARRVVKASAVKAPAKPSLTESGFVQTDNSGKSNIFPSLSKAFYSSPTTDAVAQEGLGGAQGGAVLAAALGVVALATALVLQSGTGETLVTLQGADSAQSLAAIAQRISASL